MPFIFLFFCFFPYFLTGLFLPVFFPNASGGAVSHDASMRGPGGVCEWLRQPSCSRPVATSPAGSAPQRQHALASAPPMAARPYGLRPVATHSGDRALCRLHPGPAPADAPCLVSPAAVAACWPQTAAALAGTAGHGGARRPQRLRQLLPRFFSSPHLLPDAEYATSVDGSSSSSPPWRAMPQ